MGDIGTGASPARGGVRRGRTVRFASTVWGEGGFSEPVPVRVVRGYVVFVFYISNGWRVAESEIDRWPGASAARAQRARGRGRGNVKLIC